MDEFTRECLAIEVSGSIRSGRVIEVLSRLGSVRGAPRYLRSDNGSELISRAILRRLVGERIETALIDPGKPWLNRSNESFNGKFRDECLGMQWFQNRTEARAVIEVWRKEHNTVRPHSSLGDLTPAEFAELDAIHAAAWRHVSLDSAWIPEFLKQLELIERLVGSTIADVHVPYAPPRPLGPPTHP